MPLILAIEPDRKQAALLASIGRQLGAELVIAPGAERGLESIGDGVPDLILTSALLLPRDDAVIADWLRRLDAAAAHVQMLTIPVLAKSSRKQRASGGRLLGKLRSTTNVATPDGCDPALFAAQVREYLDRAAAERRTEEDRRALARQDREAEGEAEVEVVSGETAGHEPAPAWLEPAIDAPAFDQPVPVEPVVTAGPDTEPEVSVVLESHAPLVSESVGGFEPDTVVSALPDVEPAPATESSAFAPEWTRSAIADPAPVVAAVTQAPVTSSGDIDSSSTPPTVLQGDPDTDFGVLFEPAAALENAADPVAVAPPAVLAELVPPPLPVTPLPEATILLEAAAAVLDATSTPDPGRPDEAATSIVVPPAVATEPVRTAAIADAAWSDALESQQIPFVIVEDPLAAPEPEPVMFERDAASPARAHRREQKSIDHRAGRGDDDAIEIAIAGLDNEEPAPAGRLDDAEPVLELDASILKEFDLSQFERELEAAAAELDRRAKTPKRKSAGPRNATKSSGVVEPIARPGRSVRGNGSRAAEPHPVETIAPVAVEAPEAGRFETAAIESTHDLKELWSALAPASVRWPAMQGDVVEVCTAPADRITTQTAAPVDPPRPVEPPSPVGSKRVVDPSQRVESPRPVEATPAAEPSPGHDPVSSAPRPEGEVARPAPAREDVRPRQRGRNASPDEWGLFDPNQCGFAALLEKLNEIGTSADDAA